MRKTTSIILAASFIIVSVTGIKLAVNHYNYSLRHIHELAGFLFILAGLVHLKLNMKPLLSYIKRK